jgi:MFS family permease
MSADLHWGRETFAFAMAVQNLIWGAATPFAGMLADRFGAHRVALVCGLLYAIGLVTMAHATTPLGLTLTAGVLIGIGLAGVSFTTIAGALGRTYPPEKRSMALGISAAAGSFGQFAVLPLTQLLLSAFGWYGALVALGGIAALMVPLSLVMVDRVGGVVHTFQQSATQAIGEAMRHRGYLLLTAGFFVCGFQVVFVGVHLPAACRNATSCRSSTSRARSSLRCSISFRCRRSRCTCSPLPSGCCGCPPCRQPTASSRRCSACAISRCSRGSRS